MIKTMTVLFILFTTFLLNAETWKIISFKGKVAVKKNKKILKSKFVDLSLNKNDAIKAYGNSEILLQFPDMTKVAIRGPFYKKLNTFKKNDKRNVYNNQISKSITNIFKREQNNKIGAVRGRKDVQKIAKYIEKNIIQDAVMTINEKKNLEKSLKQIEIDFNAAKSYELILCKAIILRNFKQYASSLKYIIESYERITNIDEKNILYEEMSNNILPIMVNVKLFNCVNNNKIDINSNFKNNERICLKMKSVFDTYWASFYFENNEYNEIEIANNIPSETYELPGEIIIDGKGAIIIVATYNKEKLSNINLHKMKENIISLTSNSIIGTEKLVFKLKLRAVEK